MDSGQPASLYRFPVGRTLFDVLMDIIDNFVPFYWHALELDVATPAVSRSPWAPILHSSSGGSCNARCWAALWHRRVACGGAPRWLRDAVLLPPSFVAVPLGAVAPQPGPSSAFQPQLITPLVMIPAPIPSAVPIAVAARSAAALSGSSRSPASSESD